MFNRKLFSVLILVAVLLSLSAPVVGAQQPSIYAAINVTGVTSGTPAVGSNFTTDVQLTINTVGAGLVGMEMYMSYNSATVNPVDADSGTPGLQPAQLQNGFFGTGPIAAANEVIISAGMIAPGISVPGRVCPGGIYPCVHISLAGPAQTNKTGVVARLNWIGVANGTTDFTILNPVVAPPPFPAPPYTALSDADGYLIPINTATTTNFSILDAGSIGGIVLRQGVPPSVGPGTNGCTQVNATNGFVVAGPFLTLMTTGILPAQVNTPGGFMLTVPAGGTYTVRASYPGYLQAQKSSVFASGGQTLIGTTRLWGGDVNGDNNVNILDIVAIIGHLGDATGPVGSGPACAGVAGTVAAAPPDSAFDINDNGMVEIGDLSIATGNFGKTGPTTWAP